MFSTLAVHEKEIPVWGQACEILSSTSLSLPVKLRHFCEVKFSPENELFQSLNKEKHINYSARKQVSTQLEGTKLKIATGWKGGLHLT